MSKNAIASYGKITLKKEADGTIAIHMDGELYERRVHYAPPLIEGDSYSFMFMVALREAEDEPTVEVPQKTIDAIARFRSVKDEVSISDENSTTEG